MHPNVAKLAFLLGTWRGEGEGHYPTIEPFSYVETVWFEAGPPNKPFLSYRQATRRRTGDGEPLHAELGYVRCLDTGAVELVIAQPTGIAEVHSGSVSGQTLTFRGDGIIRTATAVEVSAVTRVIEVDGDVLRYDLSMAAVGQPLQHHLAASLARVEA
jgi:hypothetical protein